MKRLKKMLLVGATEKHAGKTTLTENIIKKEVLICPTS